MTVDTIEIRRATLADAPFIRQLALASLVFGIPEDRDIAPETVAARAAESLKNLEVLVHRRRECAILVAVDTAREGHRAGYLILEYRHVEETTGEHQAHVYDLAVEPAYMRHRVGSRLVAEAARLTHQQGYRYMSAMVTASNERALRGALSLGFEVERYKLVMTCDANGAVRKPERSAHDRLPALGDARSRPDERNNLTMEKRS